MKAALKGWGAKTKSDASGFGRMMMEGLEAAEDVIEEVSIDDITECTPKAASAVELESTGGGHRLVKKAKGTS